MAEIGHGYAKKNTPMGEKLFKTLKDGKIHQLVVDIQYLPNSEDSGVFQISELVSVDSWLIDEGEKGGKP